MLYYRATWQEMVASLPPAEVLELLSCVEGGDRDDTGWGTADDTT